MVFHRSSVALSSEALFQNWESEQIFFPIDLAWGRLVTEHFSLNQPDLIFTVVFLSHLVSQNHITLDLHYWAGRDYPSLSPDPLVTFDSKEKWIRLLKQAPKDLLQTADQGGGESLTSVLVLDGNKVYFNRYYYYQEHIARLLVKRNHEDRLLIVTGGPGTGKTTRVFKEILKNLQNHPNSRTLLLAPTGKAAGRLRDTVRSEKAKASQGKGGGQYEKDALLLERIPDTAFTVHQFLEMVKRPPSVDWVRGWDLVVVDEVSMVSFPLFYQLLTSIENAGQLVLLGDKNQLSSIEEGSLFYELSDMSSSPLKSSIEVLRKSYRYPDDSLIAQASQAIRNLEHVESPNTGGNIEMSRRDDLEAAQDFFLKSQYHGSLEKSGDLVYFPKLDWAEVNQVMETFFKPYFQKAFETVDPYLKNLNQRKTLSSDMPEATELREKAIASLLDLYKKQVILCSRHKGPWGVQTMNRMVVEWLRSFRVSQDLRDYTSSSGETLRAGDPVIVNRNRYELGLYNGDVGVVLPVSHNLEIVYKAFFEGEVGYREYPLEILDDYSLSHALTVHRSQGSEFERVMVMMGSGSDFLTREICYTAITRARKQVFFFLEREHLQQALSRSVIRHSGLREAFEKWAGFFDDK